MSNKTALVDFLRRALAVARQEQSTMDRWTNQLYGAARPGDAEFCADASQTIRTGPVRTLADLVARTTALPDEDVTASPDANELESLKGFEEKMHERTGKNVLHLLSEQIRFEADDAANNSGNSANLGQSVFLRCASS